MQRTGFKRLTYEEFLEKQKEKREKQIKKRLHLKELKSQGRVKPKQNRVKTLKTKLWVSFSKYIRKSYADMNGMVTTCDNEYVHWKETDCGHLYNNSERNQQLGGNALWYYENNFAPQSSKGNRFNFDDSAKVYMIWAIKKYGLQEVEEMRRMKEKPIKYTEEELEQKVLYYNNKFLELDNKFNI